MRDVFPVLEPGKSKGLNHLAVSEKGISYLGATNLNNGVLDFVTPAKKQIQKGNCIAFIRNGEGSMGYAGTFITTVADRIRGKYNFGYKRNAARLAKEILTLPITPQGEIDWTYMESYMRRQEHRTILTYLQSIAARTSRG